MASDVYNSPQVPTDQDLVLCLKPNIKLWNIVLWLVRQTYLQFIKSGLHLSVLELQATTEWAHQHSCLVQSASHFDRTSLLQSNGTPIWKDTFGMIRPNLESKFL